MCKFRGYFLVLVLLLVALFALVFHVLPTTPVASADTGWERQIRGSDTMSSSPQFSVVPGPEIQITTNIANQRWPRIWNNRIVWIDWRYASDPFPDPFPLPEPFAIYMCEWNGSTCPEIQIMTDIQAWRDTPIWGNRIVWADERNGHWDIYMCEWNGSTCPEIPITADPGNQMAPDMWENRIVWADDRDGLWENFDIYMCEWNGSTCPRTQITTNIDEQYRPAIWGDRIAFVDERNGNSDIYMVELQDLGDVADLSIDKSDELVGLPRTGETIPYSVTVENLGPDDAAAVRLVDFPPIGLQFRPNQSEVLGCSSCSCSKQQALVVCDLGDMAWNSSLTALLVFDVATAAGEIINEAEVSSSTADEDTNNNLSTWAVEVIAEDELPSGVIVGLALSEGESGTITFGQGNPGGAQTTDGEFFVEFLGDDVKVTLADGAICSVASPCSIQFTLTDQHLADAGLTPTQLGSIVILHDPEEDGTFNPLPTTIVDGPPSPYTLEATITSTSYLGAGFLVKDNENRLFLLIAEVIMLIGGLYVLITGKIKLTEDISLEGSRARIASFFLIAPFPLALLVGLLTSLLIGTGKLPASDRDFGTLIELLLVLGGMAAFVIYALILKPKEEVVSE